MTVTKYTAHGASIQADGVTVAVSVGGDAAAAELVQFAQAGLSLQQVGLGTDAWLPELAQAVSKASQDAVSAASLELALPVIQRCSEHLRAAIKLLPKDGGRFFTVVVTSRLGTSTRVTEAPNLEAAKSVAIAAEAQYRGGRLSDFQVIAAFTGRQKDLTDVVS
jgi:hypothetical protein